MNDYERAQRFFRLMDAYFNHDRGGSPGGIDLKVNAEGVTFRYAGRSWTGATLGACLDQAEAWALKMAAEQVKETREVLDRYMVRQRELEKALRP